MRRRGWLPVVRLGLLVGTVAIACSGDSSSGTPEGVDADGPRYVVARVGDWELQEAIRSTSGMGPMAAIEPSMEWWAEYERSIPRGDGVTEGQLVRVSGHDASIEEQARELPGLSAAEGEIAGRPARWGRGSDGPAIATVGVAPDFTIMVLSYELTVDEVRAFAAGLEDATEAEWKAHGARVVECWPNDPSCPEE